MIKPNQVTRPRWCPRCLTRMRVLRNPYYGVGLAVHQHLSACPQCGFVEFLPAPARRADTPADAEAPGREPVARRVRALAARLFGSPRWGSRRQPQP